MVKKCRACSAIIEKKSNQWARQIYCTTACRKSDHRKQNRLMSRIERRRSNLRQNDEMIYLVKQCRRAKTVEILKGHTLESFIETIALVRNRPQGQVELCHVAPVKGDEATGLFHCRNLFYAGAHQNRRNGRKNSGKGLSINNEKLLREWAVDTHMTTNDILLKIELYLGDIIPRYLKAISVRKSRNVSFINKILEVDSTASFDDLMLLQYRTLVDRWADLSHAKTHLPPRSRESKFIAYLDSINRFITYGGEGEAGLKRLRKVMVIAYMALSRIEISQTFNKDFYVKYAEYVQSRYVRAMLRNVCDWSQFKDLVYDAAFDALQGNYLNIKRIEKEIMSYLVFP
ncbi:hypothetical protein [Pseudomonas helleri]|uniref:hypothetical protein n=1 Tax=Pseudomonas helleri TaxID=1608996 RepID=UPI003F97BC50